MSDLTDILNRINARLTELGLSEYAASRLAGHPDAIRNIRRALAKGKGAPTVRVLTDLAPVLERSPAWLLGASETKQPQSDPLAAGLAELEVRRARVDHLIKLLREELDSRGAP